MSQINNNFKTAIFADCLANSQEIFQLIDLVFPIDSCRHYKVLPLKIVDDNLTLGMLDPLNEESLKFVNSIARVFKYNLEIQLIDEQTFQIIIASYPQDSPQSRSSGDRNQTVVDDNFNPDMLKINNSQRQSDSAPTIISELASAPQSTSQIPNLPRDLSNEFKSNRSAPKPKSKDLAATLFEIPPEFLQQKPQPRNLDDRPTIIGENPAELLAQEKTSNVAEAEAKISQLINQIDDSNRQIASDDNFLPELLSELSWQKLLDRAFKHQTEQINLTRYSDRAEIIAIQNKLPQSTLKKIPLPIFCSLTDEIEQVARLTHKSDTVQKVVLEKFYEQERILLRFKFIPLEPEKIQIQILRGRTLKIYEQQQMDRVSDRALELAKQLEKTLKRIQVCFDSAELNNLKELQAVQSRINHQLRLLDK